MQTAPDRFPFSPGPQPARPSIAHLDGFEQHLVTLYFQLLNLADPIAGIHLETIREKTGLKPTLCAPPGAFEGDDFLIWSSTVRSFPKIVSHCRPVAARDHPSSLG